MSYLQPSILQFIELLLFRLFSPSMTSYIDYSCISYCIEEKLLKKEKAKVGRASEGNVTQLAEPVKLDVHCRTRQLEPREINPVHRGVIEGILNPGLEIVAAVLGHECRCLQVSFSIHSIYDACINC